MTSLLIDIERREDVRLFEELAARLGFRFFKLSETDSNLFARRALVARMSDIEPGIEVPEDLILETIEEIRTKRYEEIQNQGRS